MKTHLVTKIAFFLYEALPSLIALAFWGLVTHVVSVYDRVRSPGAEDRHR